MNKLGSQQVGGHYEDYLMLMRDAVEIYFFLQCELDLLKNDGMCYIRVSDINDLYKHLKEASLGEQEVKPWKQKEFSMVYPDVNLLTFGEGI